MVMSGPWQRDGGGRQEVLGQASSACEIRRYSSAYGQIAPVRRAIADQLEGGVAAQRVVVVLVLVVGQDAVDPLPDQRPIRMPDIPGSGVGQRVGEGLRQGDRLIELADRQESGVAGELRPGDLDFDRFSVEEIEDKRQHTQ